MPENGTASACFEQKRKACFEQRGAPHLQRNVLKKQHRKSSIEKARSKKATTKKQQLKNNIKKQDEHFIRKSG